MKLPTPEIIAQAKSLNYYVEHLIDPDDPETGNIMDAWIEMEEKYDFSDQVFEEDGHFGIKDAEGHLRVPARYRDFDELFDLFYYRDLPVSAINDEGKAALVQADGTGTPLCDFVYDHILLCQDNPHYFLTVQQHKFGLITSRGECLLPCVYHRIEDSTNGIFPLRQENKYGFFCENGRGFTVPCIYDDIEDHNTFVYARLGEQKGYFNLEGRFIAEEDVPHPESRTDLLRFV